MNNTTSLPEAIPKGLTGGTVFERNGGSIGIAVYVVILLSVAVFFAVKVKFSLQENEDEEEEEDWGDEESFEKECERPAKKGKNVNFASSLCRYDRTTLPTEGQSSRSAKRPPQTPRESRHMPPNRASINISWNNFCNQFRGPLSKLTLGGGKTAATTPEPIRLGSEDCYVGSQPVLRVQYKHPTYEDMRPCVAFVSSEECMRSIDSEVSNK